MNKNQKKYEVLLLLLVFKNCELIRNSSIWHSNFIPSVRDSVLIIGLGPVTYTFGLRFNYKHWVRFLSKSEFWLSWVNIPILFVGSQSVLIEIRIIWYQSTGSKIKFTIPLSFVSCYHHILFRLCSLFLVLILWLHQVKIVHEVQKKCKKKWKKGTSKKK